MAYPFNGVSYLPTITGSVVIRLNSADHNDYDTIPIDFLNASRNPITKFTPILRL